MAMSGGTPRVYPGSRESGRRPVAPRKRRVDFWVRLAYIYTCPRPAARIFGMNVPPLIPRLALAVVSLSMVGPIQAKPASSPKELVRGVNDLAVRLTEANRSATVSPSAAFYTLVMLEHFASGGTLASIGEITRTPLWRDSVGKEPPAASSGWLRLENTWGMAYPARVSEEGKRVAKHFRTEFREVDFGSERFVESSPFAGVFSPSDGIPDFSSGMLLTRAEFAPRFPDGLRPVGSGDKPFARPDGSTVEMPFLQSAIIPAEYREAPGGFWQARIPLSGDSGTLVLGSEALVTEPAHPGLSEWQSCDVIVFVPRAEIRGTVRLAGIPGFGMIAGDKSDYGKALSFGSLSLRDWVLDSRVVFCEHSSNPPPARPSSSVRPPRVLTLDRPFHFQVIGPEGGVHFSGRFDGPPPTHK